MHVTCPCCAETFPLAAGFADADGKRLAALLAGVEPALGRAIVGYLRLWKPAKQGLRTARAVRIVQALLALATAPDVCRDERSGVRRPATPALWAEGIEHLLADTGKLVLPLTSHGYLRAIVYGLADAMDAAAERQREAQAREGAHLRPPSAQAAPAREDKLSNELAYLRQMRDYGQLDEDTFAAKCREARERLRGAA